MDEIQIPETYKLGFDLLLKLNIEQVTKIALVLSTAPIGAHHEDVSIIISNQTGLSTEDSAAISDVVFSLIWQDIKKGELTDELLHQLMSACTEMYPDMNETDVHRLETNLKTLLSSDKNIQTTLKIEKLRTSYKCVFQDATIFSDVRLVFDSNIEIEPRYGIINHQLTISYDECGSDAQIDLNMTLSDLRKLKDAIIRAELKETLIKNNSIAPRVNFIDYKSSKYEY
ncbi:MAG: hypothetical protein ACOJUL_01085 [Candidatus Pollutiaquabacter aromativorans]